MAAEPLAVERLVIIAVDAGPCSKLIGKPDDTLGVGWALLEAAPLHGF